MVNGQDFMQNKTVFRVNTNQSGGLALVCWLGVTETGKASNTQSYIIWFAGWALAEEYEMMTMKMFREVYAAYTKAPKALEFI